jgi:dTDP-4-amino-4,6-dideoxygalactose transaminase
MEVMLLDLKRQYEPIRADIEAAMAEVFGTCGFVLGQRVTDFEAAVADYSGVAGAVGVASGTDALLLSCRACGVKDGEEVITTPYTFFATGGAIWNAGGRPAFVDIEPATFNLDPAGIEAAITGKTRAIMPVHLFGQMVDMDPILTIAEKHGLKVIEDAAQSIGATYQGKSAGSMGDLGCFSFFPSKNLGAAGDGGMIVSNDEELLAEVRVLRAHGGRKQYMHDIVGWNSRLDALQAAVLSVKLPHLPAWSEGRRRHAAVYDEAFLPMDEVSPPPVLAGCTPIYNQYVIRAKDRDALKAYLAEEGIGSAIYYPLSLHEQECFAGLGYKRGDFPESERAAAETLSLPVYAELTDEEQAFVIKMVKEFYAR